MSNQNIFKGLGPNWKWASIQSNDFARIHTEEPTVTPTGSLVYKSGSDVCARVALCDLDDVCEGMHADVWVRTDFSNGPDFNTDAFCAPHVFEQSTAWPEAGKPGTFIDANQDTENEMRDLEIGVLSKPLREAKERAARLTCATTMNGVPYLSVLQYMAIFGELPE